MTGDGGIAIIGGTKTGVRETRNTRKRRITAVVLILMILAFIWGNSLLPGEISRRLSGWVRDLLGFLFPSDTPDGIHGGEGILRKIAHFTEFCGLGMSLAWLCGMLGKHPLLPLCGGILAAWVDETIQLFVPGRRSAVRDVCIDALGVCLGIALLYGGYGFLRRIRRKKTGGNRNGNG